LRPSTAVLTDRDPARGLQPPWADLLPRGVEDPPVRHRGGSSEGVESLEDELRHAYAARAVEGSELLAQLYAERLAAAGLVVRWHVILTWDETKTGGWMDPDRLASLFAWWIRGVNLYVASGRRDCKHRFGHSFFAYLAGPDRGGRRGRLHWHALTSDLPTVEARRIWWRYGSSKIRPVAQDEGREQLLYVAREAVKGGDPRMWIPRRVFDWRHELHGSGAGAGAPVPDPELPAWVDW
jgi:hypothetical protein